MKALNEMKLTFPAVPPTGIRPRGGGVVAQLDPTVDELADLRTAIFEAVTNCIVHAYPDRIGDITMTVRLYETGRVTVKIQDKGCGIEDVELAMEPLYTTGGEDRSGLGFL